MLDKDKITRLVEQRIAAHAVQYQAAEQAGLDPATLSRIKNGHYTKLDTVILRKLALWLGVATDDLYLPVEAAA